MTRTLALLLVLVAGCSSVAGAKGIPGVEGISYDEAVEIARDQIGPHPEFIRAEAGNLGDFDDPDVIALPDEPRDRLVWAVFFRGIVPSYCPLVLEPPPSYCIDQIVEMRVVLDYRTGEFLYESERPIS